MNRTIGFVLLLFVSLTILLSGCISASTPISPTAIPSTATQAVFAIFDPEYIYINPALGDTPFTNQSIRIGQPGELKGGSIIAILGEDGKVVGYDHFNLKSYPSSGNIVSYLFSNGTEHTIIGEIALGDYYVFTSSEDDPLRFRCDVKMGYVYVGGKGTVKMRDGTIVDLGK